MPCHCNAIRVIQCCAIAYQCNIPLRRRRSQSCFAIPSPFTVMQCLSFAILCSALSCHCAVLHRRALPLRFFAMPCRRAALHFIALPLRFTAFQYFALPLRRVLRYAVACQCYPLPKQCNVMLCRCFAIHFTSVLCRCSAALSQFCCLCPCDCLLHHSKPLLCFAMRWRAMPLPCDSLQGIAAALLLLLITMSFRAMPLLCFPLRRHAVPSLTEASQTLLCLSSFPR